MRFELSLEEEEWLNEQIDKSLRTTREKRLQHLVSLQKLFLTAIKQNHISIDPKEFEAKEKEEIRSGF